MEGDFAKSARASGTEVSRAELCLGPCSICGRRSLAKGAEVPEEAVGVFPPRWPFP